MALEKGDPMNHAFSFMNEREDRNQRNCWLTYTNEETHQIIRDNLMRAPKYAGKIHGVGARYCPSIEDKVVRFADKKRHQLFIEPEALTRMKCTSRACRHPCRSTCSTPSCAPSRGSRM